MNVTLVWMDEQKAKEGSRYILKNGAREITCKLSLIETIIDPVTLELTNANGELSLNEIATAQIKLSREGYFDAYSNNKLNGHFILIDELTNSTVGLGFIQ